MKSGEPTTPTINGGRKKKRVSLDQDVTSFPHKSAPINLHSEILLVSELEFATVSRGSETRDLPGLIRGR